jgi:hypothetical protein
MLIPAPNLRLPKLRWKDEVQYVQGPRRLLGLKGGKVMQILHPAPWYSPEGVETVLHLF